MAKPAISLLWSKALARELRSLGEIALLCKQNSEIRQSGQVREDQAPERGERPARLPWKSPRSALMLPQASSACFVVCDRVLQLRSAGPKRRSQRIGRLRARAGIRPWPDRAWSNPARKIGRKLSPSVWCAEDCASREGEGCDGPSTPRGECFRLRCGACGSWCNPDSQGDGKWRRRAARGKPGTCRGKTRRVCSGAGVKCGSWQLMHDILSPLMRLQVLWLSCSTSLTPRAGRFALLRM